MLALQVGENLREVERAGKFAEVTGIYDGEGPGPGTAWEEPR